MKKKIVIVILLVLVGGLVWLFATNKFYVGKIIFKNKSMPDEISSVIKNYNDAKFAKLSITIDKESSPIVDEGSISRTTTTNDNIEFEKSTYSTKDEEGNVIETPKYYIKFTRKITDTELKTTNYVKEFYYSDEEDKNTIYYLEYANLNIPPIIRIFKKDKRLKLEEQTLTEFFKFAFSFGSDNYLQNENYKHILLAANQLNVYNLSDGYKISTKLNIFNKNFLGAKHEIKHNESYLAVETNMKKDLKSITYSNYYVLSETPEPSSNKYNIKENIKTSIIQLNKEFDLEVKFID